MRVCCISSLQRSCKLPGVWTCSWRTTAALRCAFKRNRTELAHLDKGTRLGGSVTVRKCAHRYRHFRQALPDENSPSPGSLNSAMESQSVAKAAVAAVVLLGVVGVVWFSSQGLSVEQAVEEVTKYVSESGSAGPLIFVLAYIAAAVLFVPASLLTLAAGYLYGPLLGTGLVSVASTTGATLSFLICRFGARPYVEKLLEGYPKFLAVDSAVSKQGARIVFLLRLSPLFPYNVLNYALGLTQVQLLPYVGASWAGMLPGTFAYVYLGSAGKAAVDAAGQSTDWIKLTLYGVGAVATLLATKYVSTAASDALKAEQSEQEQS